MMRIVIFILYCVASVALGDVLYSNFDATANSIYLPTTTSPSPTEASIYAATYLFVPSSIYGESRLCNITSVSIIGTNDVNVTSYTTSIPPGVGHALNVDLYDAYNLTLPNDTTKIGSWRSAYSNTPWPPTYGQPYTGLASNFSLWTSDIKKYWVVVSVRLDTPGYVGLLRVVNASDSRMCGNSSCFGQYTRYMDMRGTFGFANWTYSSVVYQKVYGAFVPYTNTLYLETEITTDCSPPLPPVPVDPPIDPPVPISPPVDPPVDPPVPAPVPVPVPTPVPVTVPIEPVVSPTDPPVTEEQPPTASEPTPYAVPASVPKDADITPDDITPTNPLTIVFATLSSVFLVALMVVMLIFLICRARLKRIAERSGHTEYQFSKDLESASQTQQQSEAQPPLTPSSDATGPPPRPSTKKSMEDPIQLSSGSLPVSSTSQVQAPSSSITVHTFPNKPLSPLNKHNDDAMTDEEDSTSGYDGTSADEGEEDGEEDDDFDDDDNSVSNL